MPSNKSKSAKKLNSECQTDDFLFREELVALETLKNSIDASLTSQNPQILLRRLRLALLLIKKLTSENRQLKVANEKATSSFGDVLRQVKGIKRRYHDTFMNVKTNLLSMMDQFNAGQEEMKAHLDNQKAQFEEEKKRIKNANKKKELAIKELNERLAYADEQLRAAMNSLEAEQRNILIAQKEAFDATNQLKDIERKLEDKLFLAGNQRCATCQMNEQTKQSLQSKMNEQLQYIDNIKDSYSKLRDELTEKTKISEILTHDVEKRRYAEKALRAEMDKLKKERDALNTEIHSLKKANKRNANATTDSAASAVVTPTEDENTSTSSDSNSTPGTSGSVGTPAGTLPNNPPFQTTNTSKKAVPKKVSNAPTLSTQSPAQNGIAAQKAPGVKKLAQLPSKIPPDPSAAVNKNNKRPTNMAFPVATNSAAAKKRQLATESAEGIAGVKPADQPQKQTTPTKSNQNEKAPNGGAIGQKIYEDDEILLASPVRKQKPIKRTILLDAPQPFPPQVISPKKQQGMMPMAANTPPTQSTPPIQHFPRGPLQQDHREQHQGVREPRPPGISPPSAQHPAISAARHDESWAHRQREAAAGLSRGCPTPPSFSRAFQKCQGATIEDSSHVRMVYEQRENPSAAAEAMRHQDAGFSRLPRSPPQQQMEAERSWRRPLDHPQMPPRNEGPGRASFGGERGGPPTAHFPHPAHQLEFFPPRPSSAIPRPPEPPYFDGPGRATFDSHQRGPTAQSYFDHPTLAYSTSQRLPWHAGGSTQQQQPPSAPHRTSFLLDSDYYR